MKTKLFILFGFLIVSSQGFCQYPRALQGEYPPEEVSFYSDHQFYISGQRIWFTIYTTNPVGHSLQAISKTAYADLLLPDGTPFIQTRIKLEKGIGSGSFLIPSTTPSGKFTVRVYTNLSKVSGQPITRYPISIINTGKTFDTTSFRVVDGVNPTAGFSTHHATYTSDISADDFLSMEVQTDKELYSQRAPVSLKISNKDAKNNTISNISVAVYRLNSLVNPGGEADASMQQVIYSASQNSVALLPEIRGFVATIKAFNISDNSPAAEVPVTVSLTGKRTDFQSGVTNTNGVAYFDFENVYGPFQLLVQAAPEFEDGVRLEVVHPFLPAGTHQRGRGIIYQSDFEALEEMHNHLQITRSFGSDDSRIDLAAGGNRDILSFYGKPSKTYYLDDYRRFVTMEEVLREYVQEVNVRIVSKNYFLHVLNQQLVDYSNYKLVQRMMTDIPPLVLLDGVPVSANTLMKYDPLKVEKLDIITSRYIVGEDIYDGLLSFSTYDGHFQDLPLGNHDLIADGIGWQNPVKFKTPDYNNPDIRNSRIPDFRELLYWLPQQQITGDKPATLSFFTGDLEGKFVIVLNGITNDGQSIRAVKDFEIRGK